MTNEELEGLNRTWRHSYFALHHTAALESLSAQGVQFLWDVAPNGMLRFTAKKTTHQLLACAVAWPGASKTTLIDKVITDLKFLDTQRSSTPQPARQPTTPWATVKHPTIGDW